MITLKEAVALLGLNDSEIAFIRKVGRSRYERKAMTISEMRKKIDMRAVKVHHIDRVVDMHDGEFFGYELEVSGLPEAM